MIWPVSINSYLDLIIRPEYSKMSRRYVSSGISDLVIDHQTGKLFVTGTFDQSEIEQIGMSILRVANKAYKHIKVPTPLSIIDLQGWKIPNTTPETNTFPPELFGIFSSSWTGVNEELVIYLGLPSNKNVIKNYFIFLDTLVAMSHVNQFRFLTKAPQRWNYHIMIVLPFNWQKFQTWDLLVSTQTFNSIFPFLTKLEIKDLTIWYINGRICVFPYLKIPKKPFLYGHKLSYLFFGTKEIASQIITELEKLTIDFY